MKRRSIFVNGLIVTTVGYLCLLLYRYMIPRKQSAPTDIIVDSIGLTVILFGQYLRISARGYKSEKHLNSNVLVTTSPYAFVRNPMYLASFLVGLGLVIILFQWWVLAVYGIFFLLWYGPQIHNEQQHLIKKFGQDYIDYCKSTPCFFPRPGTLVHFKAKAHILLKLEWIKKEWNTILVWAIVIVVAEGYQDISSFRLEVFIKEILFLLLIFFYFTAFAFLFRED